MRPYRGIAFLAFLALLVAASALLAVGYAIRNVVDGGFTGEADQALLLLVLFGVGLLFAIATYYRISLVSWIGERVAADARKDLFAHVVGLSSSFFDRNRTAEIQSRLVADTSVLQTLLVTTAPAALYSLVLLIGSGILMGISSPRLAAIVLLAVPFLALPAFGLGRRVRHLSRASQDRLAEINTAAGESLAAITTVQAFNHEEIDRSRVADRVDEAFRIARQRFRAEAMLSTVTVVLIFALIAGVLWIGGQDLGAGRLSPGELTAFLIYALLAATSFGSLTGSWAQIQRALGAAERIQAVIRETPDISPPTEPVSLPVPGEGRVSFREVTFHYPSRPDPPALRDFTLEIEPGETVALVGPSGAGKSTVFNLLLRFYDPQQGRVLLDGVDLTKVHPREVRARLGLVSQEPPIFDATVAENIRYGRSGATDEEVRAVAEAAAVTEFVESLPQGFDTPLGERGLRLSAGQRQRLAIARALLKDPRGILLLDEATSALDSASERTIQQALEAATSHRTSLIIAHRLATVKIADRIVVMDSGRVVATGTHDSLVRDNGLYAALARLQFAVPATGSASPPSPAAVPVHPEPAAPWEKGEERAAGLSSEPVGWERDRAGRKIRSRPD